MKTYLIYKHTNKRNGKPYIGQTHYKNPELRWQNGKAYINSPKFYNAILAEPDGFEGFTHEILQRDIPEDLVNDLEMYYIELYDAVQNGYNISAGGNDHSYNSVSIYQLDENKTILAKFNSFKDAEDKTGISNKNLVAACKGRLKSCGGYYWCYMTDYDNFIIKKSPKLQAFVPVYQLDELKNILAEYTTVTEAARAVKGHPSKISQCCSGKRCTAYGYYWCTKDNYSDYVIKKPYEQPYNAKAVVQLEPSSLAFIAEYPTAPAAGRALGVINVYKTNIIRSCKDPKHKKQALGYIWMYKEDYENEKRTNSN